MPDALKLTLSATQTPALFGVSPYLTRWMLWQHFANGVPIDKPADGRMEWGKKLEPLLLAEAAHDLAIEVRPNAEAVYLRRGQLGCTRDADVIDPERGPGALETKCVFDYRTWMADWDGGKKVPRHYEIQLQQQMYVGDAEGAFKWGALGAWIAGEMHYFRREPIPALWATIEREADAFFASVRDKIEPDAFGSPIELPMLAALERDPAKVIDLSAHEKAKQIADDARMLAWAQAEVRGHGKTADAIKARLLALMGDAGEAVLYGGVRLRVSQQKVAAHTRAASVRTILKTVVPETAPEEV
jgi:hypothetical protein